MNGSVVHRFNRICKLLLQQSESLSIVVEDFFGRLPNSTRRDKTGLGLSNCCLKQAFVVDDQLEISV